MMTSVGTNEFEAVANFQSPAQNSPLMMSSKNPIIVEFICIITCKFCSVNNMAGIATNLI